MLMKFLEWVASCEESCLGRRSHWQSYHTEIQGDDLVITGKRVRNVKEVGRFPLPERVVELPVPSWVYTINYMLEVSASDGIPDGPFDANAARTIPMFLSEAKAAAEALQKGISAILDA